MALFLCKQGLCAVAAATYTKGTQHVLCTGRTSYPDAIARGDWSFPLGVELIAEALFEKDLK